MSTRLKPYVDMEVESTAQSSSLPTRLALHLNRSILCLSVMLCVSLVMLTLLSSCSDGALTSFCHWLSWLYERFSMNGK